MPINSDMPINGKTELNHTAPKSIAGPQAFHSPVVVSSQLEGAPGLICHAVPLSTVRVVTGSFDSDGIAALSCVEIDTGTYAIVTPQYRCDDGTEAKADVYIGSSHDCPSRLSQHLKSDRLPGAKRFFIIYSENADLNAEHVRQCEAVVQQVARCQPGANVIGQSERLRKVGAYDRSLMSALAPTAIALLAAAGFPMTFAPELLLNQVPFLSDNYMSDSCVDGDEGTDPNKDPAYHWVFRDGGDLATFELFGRHNADGSFVVEAGSHFRTDGEYNLPPEIRNRRDELLERGHLSDAEGLPGRMVLRKPCILSSACVAVRVMTKCKRKADAAWTVVFAPDESDADAAA